MAVIFYNVIIFYFKINIKYCIVNTGTNENLIITKQNENLNDWHWEERIYIIEVHIILYSKEYTTYISGDELVRLTNAI